MRLLKTPNAKSAKAKGLSEGVEKAWDLPNLEGAAPSAPLWSIRRRRRAALQVMAFLNALSGEDRKFRFFRIGFYLAFGSLAFGISPLP